eukprot:scaffold238873_cov37-Tisochrysis_lutea.AAC.2
MSDCHALARALSNASTHKSASCTQQWDYEEEDEFASIRQRTHEKLRSIAHEPNFERFRGRQVCGFPMSARC